MWGLGPHDAGDWVDLKGMILGCQDRNFHDYSWGWSFVHMLLENSKYERNFKKFFLALPKARDIDRFKINFGSLGLLDSVDGEAMLEAFMDYMKIKDDEELEELEKEWYAYLENELVITSTRGLEAAADRAYREGLKLKAKRMWEEAIEGGTETALTYHRYANLLESQGEHEDARRNWEKAIRFDPVTPEFYMDYGANMLLHGGEKEEGQRLVRLAMEIGKNDRYLVKRGESLLDD